MTPAAPLLSVEDLDVRFRMGGREARAVDGAGFAVAAGETLGLVGESGCGKSVTSLAILRLVPPPGRIAGGHIRWEGEDLLAAPEERLRAVRGREIAMVFQEPMTSFNPVMTVGAQLAEAALAHGATPDAARDRALSAMADAGLPAPESLLARYPHELSGGMKQRAMIAMGLANAPRLLICDEPTTALDVTIQAQILDLLRRLQAERGLSLLFITHNLGVVAELAHRVAVMYAGRVVEEAPTAELFARPRHPYTAALLASVPPLHGARKRLATIPGSVPDPFSHPSGCRFHPRCARATDRCRSEVPALLQDGARRYACHFPCDS